VILGVCATWLVAVASGHGSASRPPIHGCGGPVSHPPPTVYVEVDILPTAVQVDVVGELQVWNAWLGLDLSGEYLLGDDDLARIRTGAAVFFARHNRFAIDGEVRQPEVAEVIPPTDFVPGRNIPNVRVRLRLAIDVEPRSVGFVWEEFKATDLFEKQAVPAMVRYRGDVEQAVMTPVEPEYVWHTRTVPRRPPPLAVTSTSGGGWLVPLPSTLSILLGVVLVLVSRRKGWPPLLAASGLAAAAGTAIAIRHVGLVQVPGTGVRPPAAGEALSIFERLHANVYRAFEANSPDEIYDLLAVSVAPRLLDRLYGEVYESLVLRGQGGAVCKVEAIEMPEKSVVDVPEPSPAGPSFAVAAAWRVHGLVSHWGHEHRRLNQYRAVFTLAHDGRAWRIDALDVKEQSRVDDNG